MESGQKSLYKYTVDHGRKMYGRKMSQNSLKVIFMPHIFLPFCFISLDLIGVRATLREAIVEIFYYAFVSSHIVKSSSLRVQARVGERKVWKNTKSEIEPPLPATALLDGQPEPLTRRWRVLFDADKGKALNL